MLWQMLSDLDVMEYAVDVCGNGGKMLFTQEAAQCVVWVLWRKLRR
jgi:hypothetical protein